MTIQKKIVLDENRQAVGVLIDYETFTKIERVLEDYALGKLMEEIEEEETLSLKEAKEYYQQQA